MKFLFDLFPVILFFGAFKFAESHTDTAQAWVALVLAALGISGDVPAAQAPVLVATLAAIVGTVGQVLWQLLRGRKVDTMLWISLGLIVVLGGATLILRDETFIKWKPTVLYWLFAVSLLVSAMLFEKNLIRTMLQEQMTLPEQLWVRLNWSWVAFFVLMGGVNLLVAFNFPTSTWVNFKLFGATGLMVVFVVGQALVLSKYMEGKE